MGYEHKQALVITVDRYEEIVNDYGYSTYADPSESDMYKGYYVLYYDWDSITNDDSQLLDYIREKGNYAYVRIGEDMNDVIEIEDNLSNDLSLYDFVDVERTIKIKTDKRHSAPAIAINEMDRLLKGLEKLENVDEYYYKIYFDSINRVKDLLTQYL